MSGIEVGSVAALLQSVGSTTAAGGFVVGSAAGTATLAAAGVGVGLLGAAVVVGVVVTQAWRDGPRPERNKPYVIAQHRWGPTNFRSFATEKEARAAWDCDVEKPLAQQFRQGLFCLSGTSRVHGQTWPWCELDWAPKNIGFHADNNVRRLLQREMP